MSAEFDEPNFNMEMALLEPEDFVQGLENLKELRTQLGESASSEELKEIKKAEAKLQNFLNLRTWFMRGLEV